MHLNDEQIHRLAERTLRRLLNEQLVTTKAPEPQVIAIIEGVLQQHREATHQIEVKTRQLMEQYAPQISSGEVDPQRMYGMIRRQVAEKSKFELDPAEQITHVAHQVHDKIYQDDVIDYTDETKALRSIKQTLHETLRAEDALDVKVRQKIASLQRDVPERSPEWEVLYRKYMDEEFNKLS